MNEISPRAQHLPKGPRIRQEHTLKWERQCEFACNRLAASLTREKEKSF